MTESVSSSEVTESVSLIRSDGEPEAAEMPTSFIESGFQTKVEYEAWIAGGASGGGTTGQWTLCVHPKTHHKPSRAPE